MTITKADAAELLTVAAGIDQRRIGETDAIAWADLLHDLDRDDCIAAIKAHYRASTEWLRPAHIRQQVNAERQARAERTHRDDMRQAIEARRDPEESHEGYLAVSQVLAEHMAANRPMPSAYDQGQADADDAARQVPCPWCKARPRQRCTTPQTGKQLTRSHPARFDAAMEATR